MLISSPASMDDIDCHDQMDTNAQGSAEKSTCTCKAMLSSSLVTLSPDAEKLEILPGTAAVFYPFYGEPKEFLFSLQPPPPKDVV
ncbi:hypothetical protein [Emcibacter sp.]|uniref:hypothetical protein n=1 Tax=Emcibacter sp. TaxID=1979954 RepID=UPI003A8EFDDA